MLDVYSRDIVVFYQIDKPALNLFNIVVDSQFNRLSKDLIDGYKKEYGEA